MSRTVASNPAGVPVQLGHFLKADGKDLMILLGSLVIGGALLAVSWKPAAIIMGLGTFVFLFSAFSAVDIFKGGNVCPAIVIDPGRQLVAVMTDLSQGGKPVPVVKVLKQPLRRAVQGGVKKGTRLAFVAMYTGRPGQRQWNTFGGYLINTGTTNAKAIQRVLGSISDTEWERLLSAVRGLDKPYRAGLFDVRSAREADAAGPKLVARPSPLRVRPALLIAAGVIVLPIVLMVVMAVLNKMGGGPAGGNPVAQGAPAVPPGVAGVPALPPVDQQPDGAREGGVPPGFPGGAAPGGRNPVRPGVGAGGGDADRPPAAVASAEDEGPGAAGPAGRENGAGFGVAGEPPLGGPPLAGAPGRDRPGADGGPPAPVEWRPGMVAEAEYEATWRPVLVQRIVSPTEVEIRWMGAGRDSGTLKVLETSSLRRPERRTGRGGVPGSAAAGESPAAGPAVSALPETERPENSASESTPSAGAKQFQPGMKAEASWANRWLPVTILKADPSGGYLVHWEGYSDAFDEVLPPDRLRATVKE